MLYVGNREINNNVTCIIINIMAETRCRLRTRLTSADSVPQRHVKA